MSVQVSWLTQLQDCSSNPEFKRKREALTAKQKILKQQEYINKPVHAIFDMLLLKDTRIIFAG